MAIDMHSHWRPPVLADFLRARTKPPRIVEQDGVEMLETPRGSSPVDGAFDDIEERLREMDETGITTAVLSTFGTFQWTERLPVADSLPLVQAINNGFQAYAERYPGRFAFYASLPLADMEAAANEFRRVMALSGAIGVILPGNAFLTRETAESYRPILEVANEQKAVVMVHWNPRPEDDWPRVGPKNDNFVYRLGTLDMQASLSSNMMTFCFTDYLDDFPDARVHVHNLGGNIPYEIERLDHRNYLDSPDRPLPSSRLRRDNLYVDCNSFGARAIEAGVAAYGADKIVMGTDGTKFGAEWTFKALEEADLTEDQRDMIRHDNASGLIGGLANLF